LICLMGSTVHGRHENDGGIEPSSAGLFPSELSHMDTEIIDPNRIRCTIL
jgi:hypothetical protein